LYFLFFCTRGTAGIWEKKLLKPAPRPAPHGLGWVHRFLLTPSSMSDNNEIYHFFFFISKKTLLKSEKLP